jgi:ribosomal protein S18 acetylase RimI-like enzyme
MMPSSLVVEPIGVQRRELGQLLDELGKTVSDRLGFRQSWRLMRNWKSLIGKGMGFVLLADGACIGIILYTAEYELRFSSFLSQSSAGRLPQNVTICLAFITKRKREPSAAQETFLLKHVVAHLRADAAVETIAVQLPPLYEMDLSRPLSALGFMNCNRVRMQRGLEGRIARATGPPGSKLRTPTRDDAESLMSIIYHGYFSEIDGYLFPDISAVCSDLDMFKEFISNNAINLSASVLANVQGYPSGCIIGLVGEERRNGLVGVVAVVPGMRRRGIGRAMLLYVLRKFQELHYEKASLAVTLENIPAVLLYQSLGFQEVEGRSGISVWRRSISRPLMNYRQ